MYFFINILFIIFFIIFSKFFFKSQDKFTYVKLTKIYFIFFILLIILSVKFDYLNPNQPYNYLCLIMNFMIFINYSILVGLRFLASPSYLIIEFLKNNSPCEKDKILSHLKDLNIIEKRFKILINENLLLVSNNSLSLTNKAKIFCRTLLKVKKFLGLKAEG